MIDIIIYVFAVYFFIGVLWGIDSLPKTDNPFEAFVEGAFWIVWFVRSLAKAFVKTFVRKLKEP